MVQEGPTHPRESSEADPRPFVPGPGGQLDDMINEGLQTLAITAGDFEVIIFRPDEISISVKHPESLVNDALVGCMFVQFTRFDLA